MDFGRDVRYIIFTLISKAHKFEPSNPLLWKLQQMSCLSGAVTPGQECWPTSQETTEMWLRSNYCGNSCNYLIILLPYLYFNNVFPRITLISRIYSFNVPSISYYKVSFCLSSRTPVWGFREQPWHRPTQRCSHRHSDDLRHQLH
jgi:hypothetical protein